MRTEISYSPSFAMATVHLDVGESIHGEAGAMMTMSPSLELETSTRSPDDFISWLVPKLPTQRA
ncbi:MAG: AIM24 family protein [Acidimicrobiales bacterium]